jgi:hypothetical protein
LLQDNHLICPPQGLEKTKLSTLSLPFIDANVFAAAESLWKEQDDLLFLLEDSMCHAGQHERSMYRPSFLQFVEETQTVVLVDSRPVLSHHDGKALNVEFATGLRMTIGPRETHHQNLTLERRSLSPRAQNGFFGGLGGTVKYIGKQVASVAVPIATKAGGLVLPIATHIAVPILTEFGDCLTDIGDCVKDLGGRIKNAIQEILDFRIRISPKFSLGNMNWGPRRVIYAPSKKLQDGLTIGPTVTCIECHHRGEVGVTGVIDFDLVGDKSRCPPGMEWFKCQLRQHLLEVSLEMKATEDIDLR